MNYPRNSALDLIAGGKLLPTGWGFPVVPSPWPLPESSGAVRLRKLLIPLDGTWEFPLLVRWHYINLHAHPEVWRSMVSEENYDPNLVYVPLIAIQDGDPVASHRAISLTCGYRYDGLVSSFHGTIAGVCPGNGTLTLGSRQWAIRTTLQEGLVEFRWPSFLRISASFKFEDPSEFNTQIRFAFPVEARWLAGTVADDQIALAYLQARGLLDSFLSSPFPEERLALCWLALHGEAVSRLAA